MFRKLTEKIAGTLTEKSGQFEKLAETLVEKAAGTLAERLPDPLADQLTDQLDAIRKRLPKAEARPKNEPDPVLPPDLESLEGLRLTKPNNLRVHLELIRALLREEEWDRALEEIEALKGKASEWSEVYATHAELLTLQGLTKPAIEQWIEALELDGSRAEWHFRIGVLFKKAGDRRQAIQALTTAVQLDARAPWFLKLGDWLLDAGEKLLALEAYESAVLADTDLVEARRKAETLRLQFGESEHGGRVREAETAERKAARKAMSRAKTQLGA